MPKRKRTASEKLQYYKKKIQKYEDVAQPNVSSPSGYTSSPEAYEQEEVVEETIVDPDHEVDNDSDSSEETDVNQEANTPIEPTTSIPTQSLVESEENSISAQNISQSSNLEKEESPVLTLDPELLQALGEATDDSPDFGEKIHENLAQLWTPLLKKGLSKESKEKLTKEYLIPENCKLLQAPKLNAEIKAAITELGRGRDKKILASQQQLGVGITAVNRAITSLLNTDDKVKAIKCLSDSCRILCDLHHMQSQLRKKVITSSLDKSFCQVIQDVERDDTLFGEKLSENIKASKAIDRQSSQIKKTNNNPKPSTSQSVTGRSVSGSGNWAGHSRSTRQGGRGAGRRGGHVLHSTSRAPPSAQTSLPSTSKMRAPQQQRR